MNKVSKGKLFIFILVILIVVGSLATSYYFYQKYQEIKKSPEIISKEEVKAITTAINRFMVLPSDEEPTLATVTDQEKLKEQEFFKNSLNGDKVLIYTKAHKAILYRPSTGKVIEFAPLTIGSQELSGASISEESLIKIAIYNGTKTVGLTSDYESKIVSSISGVSVVAKANALKNDYSKPQIIDISGKNKDVVEKLEQLLSGDVLNAIPNGEISPEADILVIAGQ